MDLPSLADPRERFQAIVDEFVDDRDVTRPVGSGRRFGSSGELTIRGKIFAMLTSKGQFVVKLPRERVDELVASGRGERWGPGTGRIMKEWLSVEPAFAEEWLPLAREAREFVAAGASGNH